MMQMTRVSLHWRDDQPNLYIQFLIIGLLSTYHNYYLYAVCIFNIFERNSL